MPSAWFGAICFCPALAIQIRASGFKVRAVNGNGGSNAVKGVRLHAEMAEAEEPLALRRQVRAGFFVRYGGAGRQRSATTTAE